MSSPDGAPNAGMGQKVLIIGASSHGKVIADILQQQDDALIAGFLDRRYPEIQDWCGHPVLGSDSDLASIIDRRLCDRVIVGVGDNGARSRLARTMSGTLPDVQFATVIHRSAIIASDVELLPGTVIMAGAIINPGCRVGRHCVINTGAQLDHDCVLQDYASVGPGAVVGGNVTVGEETAISLGARVIHTIHIGSRTVVGAGAVVVRDLPPQVLAYGVPAQIIRQREPGEAYL